MRVETHKLGVSALKDSMKICGLSIDLIRVVGIIKETIMIYVSHAIEGAQKEPLTHTTCGQTTPCHFENVGRLGLERGTCSMTYHLEYKT